MNTKKCILVSALPLAVGLTMFASSQPPAAPGNREQAKARLIEAYQNSVRLSTEKARELKAAYDAHRPGASAPRPTQPPGAGMCQVSMHVDWIAPGPSPHLRMNDEVLLVGPMPISGAYQITPIGGNGPGWNHAWKQGHYFAVPDPSKPNSYNLHSVWVGMHNGDDDWEHDYTMEVTEMKDNCPDYVIIGGACHVGFGCPLDPGHAGLD